MGDRGPCEIRGPDDRAEGGSRTAADAETTGDTEPEHIGCDIRRAFAAGLGEGALRECGKYLRPKHGCVRCSRRRAQASLIWRE